MRIQEEKVRLIYYKLAPLVRKAFGPSPECIRLLIEGAIVPKITYCPTFVVRSLNKKTVIKLLRKTHRNWLVKAYRLFATTSYAKALVVTSSRSLEEIIRVRAAQYNIKRKPTIRMNVFKAIEIDVRKNRTNIEPWNTTNIHTEIGTGKPVNCGENIIVFTDGSKIGNRVGAALVAYRNQAELFSKKLKLGDDCSVFQAEVLAIREAIIMAKNYVEDYGTIKICSDSRSAIEAIQGFGDTFEIIWNIRKIIWSLEKNEKKTVVIEWVKAHDGLTENEHVDMLAKEATTMEIEPSYTNIPYSWQKRRIEKESELRQNSWLRQECPELLQKFGTSLWNKRIYEISVGKEMSWWISDHNTSKHHLKKMNIIESELCPCDTGIQDNSHLLICPLLDTLWRCNPKCRNLLNSQNNFLKVYLQGKDDFDRTLSQCFRLIQKINNIQLCTS